MPSSRALASNPVDRIQWTAPAVAASVDRRVVVSPTQARSPLAAVWALSRRGQHLEAFFGCLYYAALRPSEAVMIREADLHLPAKGWARIDLAASASRAGTAWTDHGTAQQERGLKHRVAHETRTIPIQPELVRLLRAHIKRYGTTPDGRIFQTARAASSGFRLQRGLDRGPQAGPHPPPSSAPRSAAVHTTCATR